MRLQAAKRRSGSLLSRIDYHQGAALFCLRRCWVAATRNTRDADGAAYILYHLGVHRGSFFIPLLFFSPIYYPDVRSRFFFYFGRENWRWRSRRENCARTVASKRAICDFTFVHAERWARLTVNFSSPVEGNLRVVRGKRLADDVAVLKMTGERGVFFY